MLLENIDIGDGRNYSVEVNERGEVWKTACKGRWSLSVTSTGSAWLDEQLQLAATKRLEDNQIDNS